MCQKNRPPWKRPDRHGQGLFHGKGVKLNAKIFSAQHLAVLFVVAGQDPGCRPVAVAEGEFAVQQGAAAGGGSAGCRCGGW